MNNSPWKWKRRKINHETDLPATQKVAKIFAMLCEEVLASSLGETSCNRVSVTQRISFSDLDF